MLKVGDTVKVNGKTFICGREYEPIPIGTICRVTDMSYTNSEEYAVEIVPEKEYPSDRNAWWYLESEVEKGHLEWVKDE